MTPRRPTPSSIQGSERGGRCAAQRARRHVASAEAQASGEPAPDEVERQQGLVGSSGQALSPDTRTAQVAVVGLGYVGLVIAACLARMGHPVVGVETNSAYLKDLEADRLPFFEPGLAEMIPELRAAGRLSFTDRPEAGVEGAEFIFLAVGTPKGADGQADLSQVETAVGGFVDSLEPAAVLVIKSTVPVRTAARVHELVSSARGAGFPFSVVSNPEFLQQGRAVDSFMHPDRVVLGGDDPEAVDRVARFYGQFRAPILKTDHETAAMIKYASNAFLATRVSFANEMAKLCDAVGVDFLTVVRGVGMDRRIGPAYLAPGPGFGGSCLPKDVAALVALGQQSGVEMILLKEVLRVNHRQPRYVYNRLRARLGEVRGRTVALLGLSFKADTDDVRESPAIDLARILLSDGATVHAYDPLAESRSAQLLPAVHHFPDPYEAATGADAVVICTEWAEFRVLDLARMRERLAQPILIDARNILDPGSAVEHGFGYSGIGRGIAPTS